MKFYLAGKIPKGKELEDYVDWRIAYRDVLKKGLSSSVILDPDQTEANKVASEADSLFWFGHDSWMIRESDVVIVQASQKLGVGTSQEMLVAKFFGKPVVTVLPRDTHHRRTDLKMRSGVVSDWIHPFIATSSDLIVEKLEDALDWLSEYEKDKRSKNVKDIKIIEHAIKYHLAEMAAYDERAKKK